MIGIDVIFTFLIYWNEIEGVMRWYSVSLLLGWGQHTIRYIWGVSDRDQSTILHHVHFPHNAMFKSVRELFWPARRELCIGNTILTEILCKLLCSLGGSEVLSHLWSTAQTTRTFSRILSLPNNLAQVQGTLTYRPTKMNISESKYIE